MHGGLNRNGAANGSSKSTIGEAERVGVRKYSTGIEDKLVQGKVAEHRAALLICPGNNRLGPLPRCGRITGGSRTSSLSTGLVVDLDTDNNNSQVEKHKYQGH